MKKRPIHRIFTFALAFAVSLSMLLAPLGHLDGWSAGAPVLTVMDQTDLASAHDHDHGHHHHDHHDTHHTDDSHGHNPADHSHDLPVPLNLRGQMQAPIGNIWAAVTPRSHDQGQLFGLERPPRT